MKPIFKKVGGILKGIFSNAVVRGSVKSVPFGGVFYQIVNIIKWLKTPKDTRGPIPHSPVSLAVQILFISLILWGIKTGEFTVRDALKILDFSADDFKYFFAPADTLQ